MEKGDVFLPFHSVCKGIKSLPGHYPCFFHYIIYIYCTLITEEKTHKCNFLYNVTKHDGTSYIMHRGGIIQPTVYIVFVYQSPHRGISSSNFFHLLTRAGEERPEAMLGRGCGQSGQEVEQQRRVWQIERLVPSHTSSKAHTCHADAECREEERGLFGAPEAEIPSSCVHHCWTSGQTPGSCKLLTSAVQFWIIISFRVVTVTAHHHNTLSLTMLLSGTAWSLWIYFFLYLCSAVL